MLIIGKGFVIAAKVVERVGSLQDGFRVVRAELEHAAKVIGDVVVEEQFAVTAASKPVHLGCQVSQAPCPIHVVQGALVLTSSVADLRPAKESLPVAWIAANDCLTRSFLNRGTTAIGQVVHAGAGRFRFG